MPYLKVQTNQKSEDKEGFLKRISQKTAEELNKPEKYVMVNLEEDKDLIFGGSSEPAVFMELKSIGLKESMTEDLSNFLCTLAEEELGVNAERVYIEFKDAPGKMWGWNKGTF